MICLVPFETIKFTWIGFSVSLLFYAKFEYKYLHALFRFESYFFLLGEQRIQLNRAIESPELSQFDQIYQALQEDKKLTVLGTSTICCFGLPTCHNINCVYNIRVFIYDIISVCITTIELDVFH